MLGPQRPIPAAGPACGPCRVPRHPHALEAVFQHFRVDYRKWHYTENIVLEFTDSLTTFIGNTMNPATARQAIRYLQEKGCPLSERASNLAMA